MDARTGEVVLQDNIIKHAAATGTFATAYSGTRSFTDGTTTGGYFLREGTTRGLGIETYNCKKGNSYTAAIDFVDADNNWTAAEYNNANFDNVAGDAHVGAQATYDYWKNVHGRNSYDNAGAKIKSYVHFDDVPGGAWLRECLLERLGDDLRRRRHALPPADFAGRVRPRNRPRRVRKNRQPDLLQRVGRHERRPVRHLGRLH